LPLAETGKSRFFNFFFDLRAFYVFQYELY